jgi:acetate kinase
MAVLGRVDALVFTAGIGENDSTVRARSLAGLEYLGIRLDRQLNERKDRQPRLISSEDSRVQVWVIPTNEEMAIARETSGLLTRADSNEASHDKNS